ncbi:Conserved hypothetical protein; putative insertion sequence transposase protein [Bradyrhizobium sp. ORS 285]|nr:Conserved hypothetical protein; putative insertion sequence transposase protein [Bradyrhizobium sp. ORS 285]
MVLFEQDGADETDDGVFVWEDADDLCAALDLAILPLDGMGKINGKAERFIQTALRERAYAQAYSTSDRRAEELPH